MYLALYERGWTTADIDDMPLMHWLYLPIWNAARVAIQDAEAKRAERESRRPPYPGAPGGK
jgi:hypothetical protein